MTRLIVVSKKYVKENLEKVDTTCAYVIKIVFLILLWYAVVKSPKWGSWIYDKVDFVEFANMMVEGTIQFFSIIYLFIRFIVKVILFIPLKILGFVWWFVKDLISETINFIKFIF